jgi:FimV-like protein
MKRVASVKTLMKLLALMPLLIAFSTRAFAVSLGDELILSALGDPVEVEIEVLQWEDIDVDRVQVSAATREEYDVFKLTWLPVLDNLNFNVVGPDLNGKVRVLVSSRDPLDEPFLELLLVLRWPGGSLRREYVLLFDPPGATVRALTTTPASPPPEPVEETEVAVVQVVPPEPEPVVDEAPTIPAATPPVTVAIVETPAPVAPPPVETTPPVTETERVVVVTPEPVVPAPEPEVVAPQPEPAPSVTVIVEEEVVTEAVAEPEPVPAPPAEEESDVPDARTTIAVEVETVVPQAAQSLPDTDRRVYQVRPGDSLWNIARQFRPAGAGDNLYQVLLSIHDLNRNSFINGNISLLKANAVLQVPTVADIESIDASSAEEEFDNRWDLGTQRFEAAQRGEAIPLFAERVPVEEEVAVELELPPGEEAPVAAENEGALISASETNVPQPLQIASDTEAADAPTADASTPAPSITTIPDAPAEPAATPAPALVTQTQTITVTVDTSANTPAPAVEALRVTTRAIVTAELETEVAAMRARRESAEAVAQQLQDSLAKARADRAAEASIFGTENMLLAGSAALLFGVLMGGVVFSLRIAGDLRSLRSNFTGTALDLPANGDWPGALTTARGAALERKEPHMPEMEVVELPLPEPDKTTAPAKAPPKNADDLFARMDDIIGADNGNSPKNS